MGCLPVVVGRDIGWSYPVNGPLELHCCIKPEFFRASHAGTVGAYAAQGTAWCRLVMKVTSIATRRKSERFGFRCVQSVGVLLIYEMR